MGTYEIEVQGIVDRKGNPDPSGEYVSMAVTWNSARDQFVISRDAADYLHAQLHNVLFENPAPQITPSPETRKIIQIFENDGDSCALCNDSTIWYWAVGDRVWKPWMGPIPQGDQP